VDERSEVVEVEVDSSALVVKDSAEDVEDTDSDSVELVDVEETSELELVVLISDVLVGVDSVTVVDVTSVAEAVWLVSELVVDGPDSDSVKLVDVEATSELELLVVDSTADVEELESAVLEVRVVSVVPSVDVGDSALDTDVSEAVDETEGVSVELDSVDVISELVVREEELSERLTEVEEVSIMEVELLDAGVLLVDSV
jgi:hypothetical protein